MSTEILRRGDDLAVSQADGVASAKTPIACENGCGSQMLPLDLFAFAHACSECGAIVVDRTRFSHFTAAAVPAIVSVVADLEAILAMGHERLTLDGDMMVQARVRRARLLLTGGGPLPEYADAVHAMAIDAATQLCALRAQSQYQDSKNPIAGTEAAKCAFGIKRLRRRASLDERPELTSTSVLVIPEAAHA
jgi:hypothetical protein